jgi:hypothetical protein
MIRKIPFPRALAALSCLAVVVAAAAPVPATAAEETDAARIMQRAFEANGGDDAYSRIRFNFEYDGGKTAAVSLLMAYKHYPAGSETESKVIMFNDYPPDKKDIAFLGWFYRPEQHQDEDLWLYLPELRQTRKLTRKHVDHDRTELVGKQRPEGDEFSVSELDQEELTPRDPRLDRHTLLGSEPIDGRSAYKIESVPLDAASSSYGKFISWIAQDEFLPQRVDYYNRQQALVKTVTFTWKKVGPAWVWDRLTAFNPGNGNKTVLEQTDTRVNLGLPDELFAKRMLEQGGDTFLHRIAHYVQ